VNLACSSLGVVIIAMIIKLTHRRKLVKVRKLIFILILEGNEKKSPKLEFINVKYVIINDVRVKNVLGPSLSCSACFKELFWHTCEWIEENVKTSG
jgi:hypothetical protein